MVFVILMCREPQCATCQRYAHHIPAWGLEIGEASKPWVLLVGSSFVFSPPKKESQSQPTQQLDMPRVRYPLSNMKVDREVPQ